MKNSKKILSIVLAVVMALSVMTIAASAHTSTWTEVAGAVNVKIEVTQVPSVALTDGSGLTYTAVNNDIYAVTVYAKAPANTGIMILQVPIQFDYTKFSPVMCSDGAGGIMTPAYDNGAGSLQANYDSWYTNTQISAMAYTLPARYSDTGMYLASGATTTNAALAKCLGLGRTASWLALNAEFVAKDDSRATSWYNGIDASKRICFLCLDDSSLTAKVAYLNADKGILKTGEYIEMATLYFQRNSGVEETAAVDGSFGIADAETNFGTQLTTRTTTAAQPAGYLGTHVNPTLPINYVANAKTTRVAPLADFTATGAKSQQIMFFNASGDKATISTCDYRFVAQFSNTMFPIAYDASYNVTSTNVTECGFVMANTSANKTEADLTNFTAAQLSACASGSELEAGIKKVSTANISTTTAGGSNFAFSARITNIPVAATNVAPTAYEYNAVPYVISGGTAYYGAMQTSNVNGRFTTYNATYLASLA